MEKELGSKEMLELVHRYSIVRESTPIPYDAPISISENRVEGEVVVSHSFHHFSAPTDEY
jgi:hypothetical protein